MIKLLIKCSGRLQTSGSTCYWQWISCVSVNAMN